MLILSIAAAAATPPAWWLQTDAVGYSAIDPDVADPNPNGPANIGQAKFIAKRALDALNTLEPALAAPIREKLTIAQPAPSDPSQSLPAVLAFEVPDATTPADWHARQHAPLVMGQLKALAGPFYDTLHAASPLWLDNESSDPAQQGQLQLNATKDPADPSNHYPWSSDPDDDQNLAPATIGQLKAVFSLRFETLGPTLDSDHDGLNNASEASNHTDPRNADTDNDGMNDGWEITWGLDPLNPADAAADPDGDNLSNLAEFQAGTSPTGTYRIEVLPLGDNRFFHSAADDGSVVMQASVICDPNSTLERISAPDATATRSVAPLPPGTWNPLETLVADLVADGTLQEGESLSPSGPESANGVYRVYLSNAGPLILREPGTHVATLPAEASWQAINNRGQAAAITGRQLAPADGTQDLAVADVMISHGYYTSTIPMPAAWFPAPATPSIQAFSDSGDVLVRRPLTNPDGSIGHETYLLRAYQDTFTLVRRPGLGDESIVALSSNNTRMLGTGSMPFQITPDGTPILLAALPITTSASAQPVPLATLYPNLLVPHHITADGRITLTTTDTDHQTTLLQLVLCNDSDADLMMNDWEKWFAKMLLGLGLAPADWGPLYADLLAGDLDPNTDYTGEGITAANVAALCNCPLARQSPDSIILEFHSRRNLLAWGLHVYPDQGAPERNEGLFYNENAGYYGAVVDVTSYAQLQPEYMMAQIVANPWEPAPTDSGWSRFAMEPNPGEHRYDSYSGEYRQTRVRLLADTPAAVDRTRTYLKITRRQYFPLYPGSLPDVVKVEAITPTLPAGKLTSDWIDLSPPLQTGYEYIVSLEPVELVPDYNRDGRITAADRAKVTAGNPWRFWINNDDDSGETGGDDIPQDWADGFGSSDRDSWDKEVDGVRDLVDFFPVHLDLKAALRYLSNGQYQFFLTHETQTSVSADGIGTLLPSFNVVWYPEAELADESTYPNAVGGYLRNRYRALQIAGRPATPIPSTGLRLPDDMLEAAKLGNGVALLEGRFATTHPLVLEIRKTSDSAVVATILLPLQTSEVEDMFRSKFLLENLAGGTQGDIPSSPANWPDANRNGRQFVFVHGYNVSAEQARGSNSEFFKRLFWSGSNAMFTGISWHGNESQLSFVTPDYWRNVRNAFQTSKSVADFVNALPGNSKAIAGHSLGNMVVSSAIADHGLVVSHYFMIDAAVALEAYSPATSNKDKMSHPDWRDYQEDLWSTEWHKLFGKGDNRRRMTWRNRFGAMPQAYNFYSSGEEVLKNGDGTVPGTDAVIVSGGKLSWVKQEMSKGFSIGSGGGLLHYGTGGWDFGSYWDTSIWHTLDPSNEHLTPIEARSIARYSLVQHPFFEPFVNTKFHDPALGSKAAGSKEVTNYDEFSKALAECLPSLSFAAGSNPIDIFKPESIADPGRNYDMMTLKNSDAWPRPEGEWLHGDIRAVAFLYTNKVYNIIANLGNLNQ